LATADLKDMSVHKARRMVPFLETLADLIDAGVSVRLIYAKEPSPAFREDFDRYPTLIAARAWSASSVQEFASNRALSTGISLTAVAPTSRVAEWGLSA
jgi:hypothetical protein